MILFSTVPASKIDTLFDFLLEFTAIVTYHFPAPRKLARQAHVRIHPSCFNILDLASYSTSPIIRLSGQVLSKVH